MFRNTYIFLGQNQCVSVKSFDILNARLLAPRCLRSTPDEARTYHTKRTGSASIASMKIHNNEICANLRRGRFLGTFRRRQKFTSSPRQ